MISDAADELKSWLRRGNTLIVYRGAIGWANRNKLAKVDFVTNGANSYSSTRRPYNKISRQIEGAGVIGGAIFETEVDLTHPLLYGYHEKNLPVFHRGTSFYETNF